MLDETRSCRAPELTALSLWSTCAPASVLFLALGDAAGGVEVLELRRQAFLPGQHDGASNVGARAHCCVQLPLASSLVLGFVLGVVGNMHHRVGPGVACREAWLTMHAHVHAGSALGGQRRAEPRWRIAGRWMVRRCLEFCLVVALLILLHVQLIVSHMGELMKMLAMLTQADAQYTGQ